MLSGKKLQYIRIRNNMTQVYIAECIGISERWVGKVENEGLAPSQEVYDKWLLALYGGLKPVKKEKVESSKMDNETKKNQKVAKPKTKPTNKKK